VEFHTVTQSEGVGETVVARLVAGRQQGLDLAVVGELEEALVDVAVERLGDTLAATGRVIQVLRLVDRSDGYRGVRTGSAR